LQISYVPQPSLARESVNVDDSVIQEKALTTSVQLIEGLEEEISSFRIGQKKSTGIWVVVLKFEKLQAVERGRSFTNRINVIYLRDDEGEIQVTPHATRFFFVDDDDLSHVECTFEVAEPDWERVQRFFQRYSEDHGFDY
jgi:photosystem II Psb28-2 protein